MEDFTTSEHLAGFHDKVQEGCYECYREQRLLQAKKTVNHESSVKKEGYESVSDYNRSKLSPRDGSSPWDRGRFFE